jgi:hypothetical protein
MQAQQLINQAGPLPLKGAFVADVNAPALLVVTGTLVSADANVIMQLNVYLDGKLVGSTQLWSNGAQTHRTLPTLFIGVPALGTGLHKIMLTVAFGPPVSDVNDRFSASLIFS